MKETHLSIILLMAISCNLDNIGIGIAYGARGVSIPFNSNLLIALITTFGTFLSATFGKSMYIFIRPNIARYIGSGILICAGIWVAVYDSITSKSHVIHPNPNSVYITPTHRSFFEKLIAILNNPCSADVDLSNHIDLKEGAVLGSALTLNNIANGVGAGMIGLNVIWLTVFVFVISITTIIIGIKVGDHYGNRVFGKFTGIAAGVLLIGIGIYDIIF